MTIIQRMNIIIDVASALHYLHHQCPTPMIHCDIKPQNILLDEDLIAHLGDFSLVRFVPGFSNAPESHQFSSLGVMGTIGSAAPEYGMGSQVSVLGDMYSFGVLILEIFTGRRPTHTLFQASSTLHHFVETALPEKVMEILDKTAFHGEMISEATYGEEYRASIKKEQMECLVGILEIGVACSAESPRDRLTMRQVHGIKDSDAYRKPQKGRYGLSPKLIKLVNAVAATAASPVNGSSETTSLMDLFFFFFFFLSIDLLRVATAPPLNIKRPPLTLSYWSDMDFAFVALLIGGYSYSNQPIEAINLYNEMCRSGVKPDHITFATLLSDFDDTMKLKEVLQIHSHVIRFGFSSSLIVCNSLVDSYCKTCCLDTASQLFSEMTTKDSVSFNVMITGYTKFGFREKALKLFRQMRNMGFQPSDFTFAAVVGLSVGSDDVIFGQQIHGLAIKTSYVWDVFVANALLDFYSKHDYIDFAKNLFDEMPELCMEWTV
ncbi:hypothetical protein T459_07456 [Capsicum annuum]|uniref:non-specific serine/threonine protein kinase n=1 Tax=Capsicum annuum TaxID=4072 RepID=A0A2G2ZTN6_CAPAN|nr:hypothetical protein FXO37_20207 [Capsicum annuum]PHT85350.1 hypothetical protein T459_07456 [Capsicum annuum]